MSSVRPHVSKYRGLGEGVGLGSCQERELERPRALLWDSSLMLPSILIEETIVQSSELGATLKKKGSALYKERILFEWTP